MVFHVNHLSLSGGTGIRDLRHLRARLDKEVLGNVGDPGGETDVDGTASKSPDEGSFSCILIEMMRREGTRCRFQSRKSLCAPWMESKMEPMSSW